MKRLNLRSNFALVLLLALLIPVLAACGGTPAGSDTATTAPATEATAATEPTAAEATAEGEATTAPEATAETEPTAAGDSGSTTGDNILRVGSAVFPDSLDPQKSSFSNEIAALNLNYEGLTGLNADLETVPAAAESWEYNEDATEITFKLREGLTYSDGSPLVAQDFVNAVRRALNPVAPGDYQTIIDMIEGADAIISTAVPTDEGTLETKYEALGAAAPDDQTVVFTLTKPTPYFHTLASLWIMYPAKQSLVEAGGETWWEDAASQLGNGPFQFTSIDRNNNIITYKANENFREGPPALAGVEIRYIDDKAVALQAYRNGEIDILEPDPNDVPTIKADPVLSAEYVEYPGSCTLALEFNVTKAPFDNLQVRQAFATALDREAITRDAYQGTYVPTLTWIPPGYPGHNEGETRFGYDPDAAKALLAEAGFPNGEGLPEIRYTYNSNNPANQARAEYIIQQLNTALGIQIVPDPVEGTTLTNLRKDVTTHPALLVGGWCADYPDPQNWLSVYWISTSNFAKNIGYANEEADALIAQADVETDEETRFDLYAQAQDLIIDDVGHAMMMNNVNNYLIKPYVKGIDFTPQDSDFAGQETGLYNVTIER